MYRVAVLLVLLPLACFDPGPGQIDATSDSTGPAVDPTATSSSGTSSMMPTTTSADDASDDALDGTTLELDGTSTGAGSSEGTTGLAEGSSSAGSTGEGSSSDEGSSSGGMACTPGPAEIEFESTGAFIAQGDAWQSFTADTTGDVVRIDIYWNLSGTNDSFTMNVYEGEGTGGALLHSQLFPGQGMGTFVGFDEINVLSTPLPIEAGSVYTVQGLDTFGWQSASGAVMGGTSSLGAGQHKNIRVWVEPCL